METRLLWLSAFLFFIYTHPVTLRTVYQTKSYYSRDYAHTLYPTGHQNNFLPVALWEFWAFFFFYTEVGSTS